MDPKPPFAIQLDHINAICNAAMARIPRDPQERMLGHGKAQSSSAAGRMSADRRHIRPPGEQPYRYPTGG